MQGRLARYVWVSEALPAVQREYLAACGRVCVGTSVSVSEYVCVLCMWSYESKSVS